MYREVFRNDFIGRVIFSIGFITIIVIIAIVTKSVSMLLLLIVPILIFTFDIKEKLVIENEVLRFEKMLTTKEVSLYDVDQFVTQTIDNKLVHVVDKSGKSQLEFPHGYISGKNRRRFEENVSIINASIKFTAASIQTQRNIK